MATIWPLASGVEFKSSLSWGQPTVVVFTQADLQVEQTRQHFYELSLEYVCKLQEIQERKKFEFVEPVSSRASFGVDASAVERPSEASRASESLGLVRTVPWKGTAPMCGRKHCIRSRLCHLLPLWPVSVAALTRSQISVLSK